MADILETKAENDRRAQKAAEAEARNKAGT